ncbi:MAG: hypothetical protein ABII88_04050 [Candidatus Omnitrophota bacterium]
MRNKYIGIFLISVFLLNQNLFFLPQSHAYAEPVSENCLSPRIEIDNAVFLQAFHMVKTAEVLHVAYLIDQRMRELDEKRQTEAVYDAENKCVVIKNFDKFPVYADTITPVGGSLGIFSVNKGEQISSINVTTKDDPIMEFLPKDRAMEQVLNQGFGTFLKVRTLFGGEDMVLDYIPFLPEDSLQRGYEIENELIEYLGNGKKKIRERNLTLGIEVEVTYNQVPREGVPLFAREFTVRKLPGFEQAAIEYEVLEGMRKIMSPGQNKWTRDNMSHTGQYFNSVELRGNTVLTRARAIEDNVDNVRGKPVVDELNNFYTSFSSDASVTISPVWDKDRVFGEGDRRVASRFFGADFGEFQSRQQSDRLNNKDGGQHFCAMNFARVRLGEGRNEHTIYSYYGQISAQEKLKSGELDPKIAALEGKILNKEYFRQKRAEMDAIIEQWLYEDAWIHSRDKKLNAWFAQSKLENYLRGGMPAVKAEYRTKDGRIVVEYENKVKHADQERDYGNFVIIDREEGMGNFRDVLQNRRTNMLVDPDLAETDILRFLSLVQLDGYNPMGVGAGILKYAGGKKRLPRFLLTYVKGKDVYKLADFLRNGFILRKLVEFIDKEGIKIKDKDAFLRDLIASSEVIQQADFGEGYWQDHSVGYINDFFKNFIRLFPLDKEENRKRFRELLFQTQLTAFESTVQVKPRYGANGRYALVDGKPLQRKVLEHVEERSRRNESRQKEARDKVHTGYDYETGDIFYSSAFEKMLTLLMKIADLDPHGVGVEFKAGKPGWDDSLSKLAAYFGSSARVTTDLYLLFESWEQYFDAMQFNGTDTVAVSEEKAAYFRKLADVLDQHVDKKDFQSDTECFDFWDKSNIFQEEYNAQTRLGVSGKTDRVTVAEIKAFLNDGKKKLRAALDKAKDPQSGLTHAYFYYDMTEYEILRDQSGKEIMAAEDFPAVQAKKFVRKSLPLFLEGVVGDLQTAENPQQAREVYRKVQQTQLYNAQTGNYRLNEPLTEDDEVELVTRRKSVFPRGHLENGAFKHQEGKFMTELLGAGLISEFYADIHRNIAPYMDELVYGRAFFQNVSYQDEEGRGHYARFSGYNSEVMKWFLEKLLWGETYFSVNNQGQEQFTYSPCLSGELFLAQEEEAVFMVNGEKKQIVLPRGSFAAKQFKNTLLVYHNVLSLDGNFKDTFGEGAVVPQQIRIYRDLEGKDLAAVFVGDTITDENIAHQLRDKKIVRIDVLLGETNNSGLQSEINANPMTGISALVEQAI